jgi:hypothetical protein
MTKKCLWCSTEFSPRVARQVYCKRRCKELAEQSRNRGGDGTRRWIRGAMTGASYSGMNEAERKAYHRDRNRIKALSVAGWTPETFAAAKEAQGNRCAICNEVPVKMQSEATEALVPDHKHGKPPEPRALLCPGCNAALGLLKDSPERCEAAAAYLRKFLRTPWRGPVLCG